jgi:hypothetical protein
MPTSKDIFAICALYVRLEGDSPLRIGAGSDWLKSAMQSDGFIFEPVELLDTYEQQFFAGPVMRLADESSSAPDILIGPQAIGAVAGPDQYGGFAAFSCHLLDALTAFAGSQVREFKVQTCLLRYRDLVYLESLNDLETYFVWPRDPATNGPLNESKVILAGTTKTGEMAGRTMTCHISRQFSETSDASTQAGIQTSDASTQAGMMIDVSLPPAEANRVLTEWVKHQADGSSSARTDFDEVHRVSKQLLWKAVSQQLRNTTSGLFSDSEVSEFSATAGDSNA